MPVKRYISDQSNLQIQMRTFLYKSISPVVIVFLKSLKNDGTVVSLRDLGAFKNLEPFNCVFSL